MLDSVSIEGFTEKVTRPTVHCIQRAELCVLGGVVCLVGGGSRGGLGFWTAKDLGPPVSAASEMM